ncbi:MAG: HAD family hydrolase [Vicinamibacterales bacterium]
MSARAVIFDLDNTLYPERRFALSGFAAVARDVETRDGVRACEAYRVLVGAYRSGHRASAFQRLVDAYDLPADRIGEWVRVVRTHAPRLRLARRTRRMLADLRARWRVGLVTNGLPEVQRRKVDALGLGPFFDHVGTPGLPGAGGKPDPEGFLAACQALGALPRRAVFVGDDFLVDVLGARNAGLKTIHFAPGARPAARAGAADAVVARLEDVPGAVEALLQDV